ncbi:MAG: Unknown protein [uncultured Sulfurovum sp.]|uniref:Uncharacterized protein n=1 Tax=uncultured Sulfurovum sp. TaxID=269237 RepID=A0A6S6S232_9BACT|nr:MAG: Unknown protein [uncultured Sulfurovum sp.]
MADEDQTRLLELQMADLKASYGIAKDAPKSTTNNDRSENSRKIAALYEDAAEYEEELETFEKELEIVRNNEFKDIVNSLIETFPNYEGDYSKEVKALLEAYWTQFVEVDKTHPEEELQQIKKLELSEYSDELSTKVKNALIKRWEMLVNIKKEHVAEERAEMKLRGMKPDHIRKVYRKYHGLEV